MHSKKIQRIIFISCIVILLLLTVRKCNEKTEKLYNLQNTIDVLNKKYEKGQKIWFDKNLQQHITISQLQIDKSSFEEINKQLAKQLKVKAKNINSVTILTTNTKIEKQLLIDTLVKVVTLNDILHDTLKQYNFKYSDKWVEVEGCLGDSVNCKDSISIQLTDSLIVTIYKKSHLFKKDVIKVDVLNQNPYVKFTSLSSLSYPLKKPKLGVGLSLGIGYGIQNITTKSPYPQLQLGISLIYLPLTLKF